MKADNHYEAAFADYLRSKRIGFVAVDEARRTLLADDTIKSVDFILVGSARLVVDVKGRRFPGGSPAAPRKVWQNWASAEDLSGLIRWANQLGPGYRGLLAFCFHIAPPFVLPDNTPDRYTFRDRDYLFRGILAEEYQRVMRPRSARWNTVHLATADFRRLVRPVSDFLVATNAPVLA